MVPAIPGVVLGAAPVGQVSLAPCPGFGRVAPRAREMDLYDLGAGTFFTAKSRKRVRPRVKSAITGAMAGIGAIGGFKPHRLAA